MKPDQPPARCFQGVIPALIGTCAADGTPNITYLSQVHELDDQHVALSCQFFNKTKQNVLETRRASVQLHDPVTYDAYQLELEYLRAETSGPLFEAMQLRIQGIASHTGMSGVFRLLSADVYRVLSCTREPGFLEGEAVPEQEPMTGERSELRALHVVAQRLRRAEGLEAVLDAALAALEEAFGFAFSMVLMPGEDPRVLTAVASLGYGESGAGAEVTLGEGLIGAAAARRSLLRVEAVDEALRYARAIRSSAEQAEGRRSRAPEVPLPGLPDAQALMVMPLVAGDRLVACLVVESRDRLAFQAWDEPFLQVIADQLAMALDNAVLREEREAPEPGEGAAGGDDGEGVAGGQEPLRFRFFPGDDCVFVDDQYLVRNLPGRILWKLLTVAHKSGRRDFTNRELRLDPSLLLPPVRDNLESRLVLLKKRLEQKCPRLRLESTGRGRFRLHLAGEFSLSEEASAAEAAGAPG